LAHYANVESKENFDIIDEINNHAYDTVYTNPDEGITLSRKAFLMAKRSDYPKGRAESKLNEGWGLLLQNNYQDALSAFEYSLKIFNTEGNRIGEIKTLNAFGVLYASMSQYSTAMDYYTKSLDLGKKANNPERIVSSFINIGDLYFELEKYDQALEFLQQADDILKRTKNQEQLCACLVTIGDVFQKQKNYKKALTKYNKGLIIATSINNKIYECNYLASIGRIYQKTNKFDLSEQQYQKSMKIADSIGDQLGKLDCLTNLAGLHDVKSDPDNSLYYHKKALDLSRKIHSKYYESENLLSISKIYEKIESKEEALIFFKLYHEIQSEFQTEEIDIKIKNLSAQNKIKTAQKEAAILKGKNDELQEAFDRVSILNKIGQDIISSLNLETVMSSIYKNISSFISADIFGIALYDNKLKEIDYKYFIVDGKRITGEKREVHTEGSMAGWVIINDDYLFINDLHNEYSKYVTKLLGSNSNNTKAVIFVPLKIGSNIIGIITVQSNSLNAYTQQDLEIIKAVGAYSAIALENSKVHDEITKLNKIINSEKKVLKKAYNKIDKLANHDILTGLPNRRLFIELLKQELLQTDREKTKIAVLFIDLDDFKPVNDKMGHDAGDKVLKMVSQRFISTFRKSDSIARIGGDEFAAIICNVNDKTDIIKIAEKIVSKFKNPFKIGNNKFQLGISMGISIYPDHGDTIDGLLKKADTAMYKIKSESKNSYIFYNEQE
jgi:diguanylate cyclase (GGDEF)-like protein